MEQRHGDGDHTSTLQGTLKQEGLADVRPPLVAYTKQSATREPGQCPLERALVASLPLAALDAPSAYSRLHTRFRSDLRQHTPKGCRPRESSLCWRQLLDREPGACPIGLGWLGRQQRIDGPPQLGWHQLLHHKAQSNFGVPAPTDVKCWESRWVEKRAERDTLAQREPGRHWVNRPRFAVKRFSLPR
jgi:hypothetical protein